MWITNSAEAEIFLVRFDSSYSPSRDAHKVASTQVFANCDPSKGYKGISCFLVEKEMGIEIAKKEKKVRSHPRSLIPHWP